MFDVKDLIELLRQNARYTASELAMMLNSTEKLVEKTMRNLEKSGVISKYTIIINENKLDDPPATIRALVEVAVHPERDKGFDNIAKMVYKYDNVVDHFLLSGSYDFLLVIEGKSLQDISDFIASKLSSIKNVKSTRTHFILKKYKENNIVLNDSFNESRLKIAP